MRQAVVVIHGVGEQRPMNTLRAFVKRVSSGKKYYNKPDTINTNFELRMLRLAGERKTPPTDFYEFYWAHHMRNTAPYMMLAWLSAIFSRDTHFCLQVRIFIRLAQVITALLITYIIVYFVKKDLIPDILKFKQGMPYIILSLSSIWVLFCRQIYETVGKAARYLNPTPYNVSERNTIRQEGYQLLNKLHKSKKYDRVIIVGHSLGSVIAYDIIRDYWAKTVYPRLGELKVTDHKAVKNYRNAVRQLLKKQIQPLQFQSYQNQLWNEFKEMGIQWLITDLITVGSPLTHAYALLSDEETTFCNKIIEKEFVICPPLKSENKKTWINIPLKSITNKNIWFPPSDFAFCSVRWNNIYFKQRFLFWGDPIGGKLASAFGIGICDREVLPGLFDFWSCHVNYWKTFRRTSLESINHLADAMKLGFSKEETKHSPMNEADGN